HLLDSTSALEVVVPHSTAYLRALKIRFEKNSHDEVSAIAGAPLENRPYVGRPERCLRESNGVELKNVRTTGVMDGDAEAVQDIRTKVCEVFAVPGSPIGNHALCGNV